MQKAKTKALDQSENLRNMFMTFSIRLIGLDVHGIVYAMFYKGYNLCYLIHHVWVSCAPMPFRKGIYFKRKESNSLGDRILFLIEETCIQKKYNFDKFVSLKRVLMSLKKSLDTVDCLQ